MEHKIIKIGREYGDAFKSICELYKNGFVSDDIIESVSDDDTVIVTAATNYEFQYDEELDSISGSQKIEIGPEGATWFESIRLHEEVDFGSGAWLSLITEVARDFHKKNSFLEFRQTKKYIDPKEKERYTGLLDNFFNAFYPGRSVEFQFGSDEDAMVTVYGLSFVMDIDTGAGETQKVLGKVYYKNINKRLVLVSLDEAKQIENQIHEVIGSAEDAPKQEEKQLKSSQVIDRLLNELELTIKKGNFAQGLVYNSEHDEKIMRHIINSGPSSLVTIGCRRIEILGLYRIFLYNNAFNVLHNGENVFKALFDSNGKFSLVCVHCSDPEALLVDNDLITLKLPGGAVKTVEMDINKPNFGLDEETLKKVIELSNFKYHFNIKECTNVNFNDKKSRCERITCRTDLLYLGVNEYCKKCPYPKIIYRDDDGSMHPTSQLTYVSDLHKLVEKDQTGKCSCCGRTFTLNSINQRKQCVLCSKLDKIEASSVDNVYKEYEDLFPLSSRLFFGKEKIALEDSEIVIFKFGDKKYIFNKVDILEEGFIGSPRKVK